MRLALAAAFLLALAGAAAAQPAGSDADGAPAAWRPVWPFLLGGVCTGAADRVLPGVSPLDGPACPHTRTLRVGERLPYHKRDWPGLPDRPAQPGGYQQSDAYPVRTALGPAIVQTYDFGAGPGRAFNRFDPADGGQVAFFSGDTASFGITEDGGAGLQLFLGPGCRPLDGWVVVDHSFDGSNAGETLARITRDANRCATRLGYALTRWRVQKVTFRTRSAGQVASRVLATLVSEHFGGREVTAADHLERMYFTRELGYTRWERWQNTARADRSPDRAAAANLAGSDRCPPALPAPQPIGWLLTDCREWTQIVPPASAAGDAPDFWLDRLRSAPETRGIFGP